MATVVATLVTAALAVSGRAAHAQETTSDSDAAPRQGQPMMLLVHGYGDAADGKNCHGGTSENALRYYEEAGGRTVHR